MMLNDLGELLVGGYISASREYRLDKETLQRSSLNSPEASHHSNIWRLVPFQDLSTSL